jgi:hypothetical protein
METLITTARDLHETSDFSVQQTHSFEVETVLPPSQQHPKGKPDCVIFLVSLLMQLYETEIGWTGMGICCLLGNSKKTTRQRETHYV